MGTYAEYIARRGARAFLARKLGITHSAVQQWGHQIPANRVVEVEQITGIPREALRPDLYRLRPSSELERAA